MSVRMSCDRRCEGAGGPSSPNLAGLGRGDLPHVSEAPQGTCPQEPSTIAPVPRARILVFNQYYSPAFESTAQLLTQLCESLADDYDVTVVTGVVEGAEPSRHEVNGVKVHRVWSTSFPRRRLSLR